MPIKIESLPLLLESQPTGKSDALLLPVCYPSTYKQLVFF
ncbi:hypothetical protein EVA_05820 [gut metagenome]|uniref:Uncharacterized protein n=1 Tax=gut metagenome TaxID=749906 RepID=J9D0K1_9ZZZZ